MRNGLVLALLVTSMAGGCGGDSDLPSSSTTWILGTPVLTADGTTFPVEARISVQVSKHVDHRIEPAPDGTPVTVHCAYRSDGRESRPDTETRSGRAEVRVIFERADIADLTIAVATVERDVTVEATLDGEVRLVGG